MGPMPGTVFLITALAIISATDVAGQPKGDTVGQQKAPVAPDPDPPPVTPVALDSLLQVRYAANLDEGESHINIINTGANGAPLYGPGYGDNTLPLPF